MYENVVKSTFFILVKERKVEKYKIFALILHSKTFKHLEIPNTYSGKSILRFTKELLFVHSFEVNFYADGRKTQLWFKHVPSNKFLIINSREINSS